MPTQSSKAGFSLVELSIVLVILGLLTGGVLTGQSLIRAAEIRSVSTQLEGVQTASFTFRDKYFAMPGDLVNPQNFWAGAAAAAATHGSGIIEAAERSDALQQLAFAGLIEGNYLNTEPATFVIGQQAMRAKVTPAGIAFGTGTTARPTWLQYGAVLANDLDGQVLRPEEAWNVDTKMDDGIPDSGFIRTVNHGGAAPGAALCLTAVDTYNLDDQNKLCAMELTIN